MKNKIQLIRCFFRLLGTANWYQGIDKPNLWQYLFIWRVSPKTALKIAKQIWN
jgi:hypothetical protein